MADVIYVIIIIIATTAGAFAGIGGGVLFKPVFDAFSSYSGAQISVISSCAVFSMSLISAIISFNQIKEQKEQLKIIPPLALGSVTGGWLGEFIFSRLTAHDSLIRIIQNCILLVLIIFVIVYMKGENKKGFGRNEAYIAVLTGLALGCIAAFLGIGGGPINVALLTLIFSLEIKTAVIGSLITILFAQGTKLITVAIKDISAFNLKILPFAVIAGICGALIGRTLNKKASDKAVSRCFVFIQIIIVFLCVYNIIKFI